MKLDLSSLNENQRKAVEWDGDSLLILAGPGSGKTMVLTMRVAKLLLDSQDKRFKILGLTFTKKAAVEMEERVGNIISDQMDRVNLTTFHSFCAGILRQHGSHLGVKPNFSIINQDVDREAILEITLKDLKEQNFEFDNVTTRILPLLDRLITECVGEDEYKANITNQEMAKKASVLLENYINKEIETNKIDFSTLIYLAEKLLREKEFVAKQIRTIFPFICVDEFQDTNYSQYKVLKHLAGNAPKKLFVVADDDQIIYQWNGASPERLFQLRDDYEMSVIQLPANYRCPAEVIDLANCLIKNNIDRSPERQPLCAIKTRENKEIVRLKQFLNENGEFNWVADDIKTQHIEKPDKCVVLARTKKLLDVAVNALERKGIKASLAIRKTEFISTPFRFLHAMLRLANDRTDSEQLRKICKAFYELEGLNLNIKDIISEASQYNNDYLRTWFVKTLSKEGINNHTSVYLNNVFKPLVDKLHFIEFVKKSIGWFEGINSTMANQSEEGFVDYEQEKTAWNNLQSEIISKFGIDDLTLNIYLQEFDLSEKSAPIPDDAVRCLTIHSSKGLEFNHVYLTGLAEDQLPSFQSIKKGDHSREMQEERRNCFVAITRCQYSLTMTYSQEYFGWKKIPSRFLGEMGLNS